MTVEIKPTPGRIKGIAEIRDQFGRLKDTVEFSGTTQLSESELRHQLGLKEPQNVGDPRNHDT